MVPFNSDAHVTAMPRGYAELVGKLTKDLAPVPVHIGGRFLEAGDFSIRLQRGSGDDISGVVRRFGSARTFTSYERLLEYLRQQGAPTP